MIACACMGIGEAAAFVFASLVSYMSLNSLWFKRNKKDKE